MKRTKLMINIPTTSSGGSFAVACQNKGQQGHQWTIKVKCKLLLLLLLLVTQMSNFTCATSNADERKQ